MGKANRYVLKKTGTSSGRRCIRAGVAHWCLCLTLVFCPGIARGLCCCSLASTTYGSILQETKSASHPKTSCCCQAPPRTTHTGAPSSQDSILAKACDCDPLECLARLPERVPSLHVIQDGLTNIQAAKSAWCYVREVDHKEWPDEATSVSALSSQDVCIRLCRWLC